MDIVSRDRQGDWTTLPACLIWGVVMAREIQRHEAYCARCHAKRPMVDGVEDTAKTGQRVVRGRCAVCGGAMIRLVHRNRDKAGSQAS